MSFELTDTGLTIQTYDEIFDELADGYKAIYGPDIDVTPESPDGQRIGIETKARLDIQAFALSLYNQFDPDKSTGEMQNKLIKLAGLSRRVTSRSQVDVTITTDRPLSLPEGYAVNDDLDQAWITTEIKVLISGANTVSLVAENFGAVAALADTITEPATIVLGVVSVTNPAAAVLGVDEEEDPAVRVRRNASLISPASSTAGGMFTALGNVAGVLDLVVYENDQDTIDIPLALGPHALWVVIEGGEVADIVEVMAKSKTGGTALKGSVSGTFVETLTRPDDSTFDIDHVMSFDRPTTVDLFATLTVEGPAGGAVDTTAIENALAAQTFNIGVSANAGDMYAVARSVPGEFTVTLLEISDDDITFVDGRLDPGPDEKFDLAAINITITDITPP